MAKWDYKLDNELKETYKVILRFLYDNPGSRVTEIAKFISDDNPLISGRLRGMRKRGLVCNNTWGKWEATEQGLRIIGLPVMSEKKKGILASKLEEMEQEGMGQEKPQVEDEPGMVEKPVEPQRQEIIVEPKRQIKITIEIT